MNLYETQTDSQMQRTDVQLPRQGWGRGWPGGMDWELGISRCKLVYKEWINNKVPLYSTEILGNTVMEKSIKKKVKK